MALVDVTELLLRLRARWLRLERPHFRDRGREQIAGRSWERTVPARPRRPGASMATVGDQGRQPACRRNATSRGCCAPTLGLGPRLFRKGRRLFSDLHSPWPRISRSAAKTAIRCRRERQPRPSLRALSAAFRARRLQLSSLSVATSQEPGCDNQRPADRHICCSPPDSEAESWRRRSESRGKSSKTRRGCASRLHANGCSRRP